MITGRCIFFRTMPLKSSKLINQFIYLNLLYLHEYYGLSKGGGKEKRIKHVRNNEILATMNFLLCCFNIRLFV